MPHRKRAPVICLHGPESVGKSSLATQLAARLGGVSIPEYGRGYCAAHGVDIGMDELVHIAQIQSAMIASARKQRARFVIADTDALMTAVWADMMFGMRDRWFAGFAETADLYLLLDIDLPFVEDGLRFLGGTAERQRFFDLCRDELEVRGVRWALVHGDGEARIGSALRAIEDRFGTIG
jgi:NadR type nicotinamide-nucleotide adenylyltransferase